MPTLFEADRLVKNACLYLTHGSMWAITGFPYSNTVLVIRPTVVRGCDVDNLFESYAWFYQFNDLVRRAVSQLQDSG